MVVLNEDELELIIEEHLRDRGWNVTDFSSTRKRWRDSLDGEEADRVFLYEGKVISILEAKKPGKDSWAALEQANRIDANHRVSTNPTQLHCGYFAKP